MINSMFGAGFAQAAVALIISAVNRYVRIILSPLSFMLIFEVFLFPRQAFSEVTTIKLFIFDFLQIPSLNSFYFPSVGLLEIL